MSLRSGPNRGAAARGSCGTPATGTGKRGTNLRFAGDERPAAAVSLVIGLQTAVLVAVPVVVVSTIAARAANQGDAYLSWAIFAAIVIGGLTTIVQAVRVGGAGAGTLTVMGVSCAWIGVSVLALAGGGPALLGTLVVVSGLCQLGLAARLALLRRLVNAVVSGTLMALISVTMRGTPAGHRAPAESPLPIPNSGNPTRDSHKFNGLR